MSNESLGIVGLPNVGKSTFFNALTKKAIASENYPFCTIDPNEGIVPIEDERIDTLSKLSNSEKTIYATVTFTDIAGLVKGASKGEGLGNQFLNHIRQTDALLHIVRCFDDENVVHVEGGIDPLRDIETINLELSLADLDMIEKAIVKTEKIARLKKEAQQLLEVLKKCAHHLGEGKPLRSLELTKEEELLLQPYPFLTKKKMIYVGNMREDQLQNPDENSYFALVQQRAKEEGTIALAICAKLEEELAQLSKEEAKEFLSDLGLSSSGLEKVIKAAADLLGLIHYFTSGKEETKAWTIHKGTPAAQAAGKIHTDLEKGFIRAEVISYDDMVKYRTRAQAKEAGVARFEGRDYIVKDGDVILFYHN